MCVCEFLFEPWNGIYAITEPCFFFFRIDLKFPHHTNEIAQAEAHDYAHGQDKSEVCHNFIFCFFFLMTMFCLK